MTLPRIDPTKIYEVNGQVCKLLATGAAFAVGVNQLVIAASSGYIHRVMGLDIASVTGITYVTFQSGAAGANIVGFEVNSVANGLPFTKPITDSGYFETLSGEGLYIDVVTNIAVLNVYYITYKA